MEHVYVLMEEGWEYNDETFFHPESGSGTPRKIYATLEAAEKERDQRNIKSIRNLFTTGEARQYFYSFDDIVLYEVRKTHAEMAKLEALTVKMFGVTLGELDDKLNERDDIAVNPDVTDGDWLELQSKLTLNFWDVVECEKE
jgi:hypothetical protein